MIRVAGGEFDMGSDDHYPEEAPKRRVQVDGFWISRTLVTNDQFRVFADATGYVTVAERPADPRDYPGADPAMLEPASAVFVPPEGAVDLRNPYNWWQYVPGASWRHPLGAGSDVDGKGDHPVVHVAWEDVEAYARWAGLELPTEAEWEHACSNGRQSGPYAWGDERVPAGVHMANIWQGEFPYRNSADDGWVRTSPVGTYPANDRGLYDMIGNVWEWTRDWWAVVASEPTRSCCSANVNPRGGGEHDSIGPDGSGIPRKVIKGGSHLCAPEYCRRYRPAARHAQPVDSAASHIGFRCVWHP